MNSSIDPLIFIFAKNVIPAVEKMNNITNIRPPTFAKLGMVCKKELNI